MYRAAVLADDAVNYRKAETGALSRRLCGEEGLEDPVSDLFRHPGPVVFDGEPRRIVVPSGAQGQLATVLEGVGSVDHQIHQDLAELALIAVNPERARRQIEAECDVLAHHPAQ